jgi:CBS domain-containing protein
MSPRAAWRLEALAFRDVYDYVPGKVDWLARGFPTERADPAEPRAVDVVRRDVPTCRLDERLAEVQRRARETGWDTCIVVNVENVVLGRLGRRALASREDARVDDVMTEGPSTFRPHAALARVVERVERRGFATALVTTSDGRLVGLVRCDEAKKRLAG